MVPALLLSFLAAATPASPAADEVPTRKVELAGRTYRFPASESAYVRRFDDSIEIGMPRRAWNTILARVAPLRPWQTTRPEGNVTIHLARPGELYPWETGKAPGAPPVREPVAREAVRGDMVLWASKGLFGAQDLVYVTYKDKPDIYVRCDRIALGDPALGCDLLWFDSGVVHRLGLVGDWIRHAPAQAAEYERAVGARPSSGLDPGSMNAAG